MRASYRERVYVGHRCLPPKVDSAKSYARLQLDVAAPRWTARVSEHLRLKVRFWGQEEPSVQQMPVDGLASWSYDIVVPLERLWAYLLDMRILKLEFEDARNRKTVAVGLLNLQMYPMAGSMLNVEATVQIHSIREKCKYGELEVRLRVESCGIEERGMSSHNLPTAVEPPKYSEVKFGLTDGVASESNIAPGSGVKPHSTHDPPIKPAQEQHRTIENRPPQQLNPRPVNNNLTYLVREDCCPAPHRNHNFQAEIERLRLDELQLLNSQRLVGEQNPSWLSLQIDRCERLGGRLSEQSEYRLVVEFPVMVGDALKMNVFDLACTKATGKELVFGQHIQVSTVQAGSDEQTMRQYLAQHSKFTLSERTANGNSRSIAQGLSRLSEVVGSLRSTGHLLVQLYKPATAKKESKQGAPVDYILFFKAQNWSERCQPATPEQPRVESKQVPKQKPEARHSMVCVRVGKFHNLRPEAFQDNNYMLRVKMAGQIFVSSTVWNEASPDFTFSLTSPLDPEVNGLVVELWNRGTNGLLLGIGKLDINYQTLLNQAINGGTSMYPAVVFEDDLLVSALRGTPVGYLSAAVLVGKVQQINRFLRAHPGSKKEVAVPGVKPIESVKPSELKQEETGLPHPSAPNEKPTIPKEDPDPLPAQANKGSDEVLRDVDHQTEADVSLLIDLLNEFFGMLSRGETRRELARAVEGKVSTSINEFRDMVKKELGLPLAEWAIGKLSYFFVENVRVQMPRLLCSLQSHQFYTETLLEEYTALVKELREAMEYNSLRVNQLEIQLAGRADRSEISQYNFRAVLSELLPEFHAASLELLLKLCGKKGVILYGEFCDALRKYDAHDRVVQARMDPMLLLQLVGQELSQVLLSQQGNIQELTRTQIPDRLDYRGLSRLFEQTGILVSYWEALNVIEYLKQEFGDDSQPEGDISGKLVARWLGALLSEPETRMVRSPTFGDNLFQPLPQLKPVHQQSEQGSILPALVSLDEHSAREALPSPITVPPLQLRLNFTADIARLTINERENQFYIGSPRLLFVKHKREAYYDVRLALANGEELYAEGPHGEWLAVTNMEANYQGALLLA